MNSMGQVVNIPSTIATDRILFNTSEVPKGVYFVNIELDEKSETRAVLVE